MFFYVILFGAVHLSKAIIYDLDGASTGHSGTSRVNRVKGKLPSTTELPRFKVKILYFDLGFSKTTTATETRSVQRRTAKNPCDSKYERMPPLFGLDDYHSCLHKHKSVYCLARWDLYTDTPNDLITLVKEYSEFTTKHYNHTYIQRGVCLSTTCSNFINKNEKENNSSSAADLKLVLEECINDTNWNEYALKAKLNQIYYCDQFNIETPKYDWSDWSFGTVLATVVMVNIIASLVHFFKYEQHLELNKNFAEDYNGLRYLLCFSIISNWRYMRSTVRKDPRFERLRGLYGIRAVTSFIMPLAHVMWMIGTGFTDNPRDFEKAAESFHYQLIFNGMILVQIFFTMSGFLMVYYLQIYSENAQLTWSMLPRILIDRWLRLTPMNAMMIAFTATWLRYLGSGPLWNFNVTGVVQDCRSFWWLHILYINNYEPDDRACAVQSWHLAADVQLFTFGLIVHFIMKSIGQAIPLILLLLLSMMAPAMHVWFQDLDALVLLKPEFYRSFSDLTYRHMHVLGHNNLSSFVIGMMTGYLTYYWLKNEINVFRHKLWKIVTWCVVPVTVGLLLTGNVFYIEGERPSIVIRMMYAAVHRSVMGLITAFCILSLVFKVEDAQRQIFEWTGWVVPSRLSYCIFLLHVNIIHILLGSRTQLAHVSFFYVVINHLGIVTLSYLLAVPCYLMIEAPFTRLSKTLFQKEIECMTKKTK